MMIRLCQLLGAHPASVGNYELRKPIAANLAWRFSLSRIQHMLQVSLSLLQQQLYPQSAAKAFLLRTQSIIIV